MSEKLLELAYEQNFKHFRSLNRIMWQVPIMAMTLTGGLWFGAAQLSPKPLFAFFLLLTAFLGNIAFVIVLRRFRFVMSCYLDWLESAYPAGFVKANCDVDTGKPFGSCLLHSEVVKNTFSAMLGLAAFFSLVLALVECFEMNNNRAELSELDPIGFYNQHAEELAWVYESVSFEDLYPQLVPVLSSGGKMVLDVGAGSGRDAAWIASHGNTVVAVEPARKLLEIAQKLHAHPNILWGDSRLPELAIAGIVDEQFDIILVGAVWIHVSSENQNTSLARIHELLKGGGSAYITLRNGPDDPERRLNQVLVDEFKASAVSAGFQVELLEEVSDKLRRKGIRWHLMKLNKSEL